MPDLVPAPAPGRSDKRVLDLSYQDVFARRGEVYHAAMRANPLARAAEFARLFERHPVGHGQSVLDIPAGGGYLARHLPEARLTSLELTDGFGAGVPVVKADDDWPVGRFDHVACVAALHHIEDRAGFVSRLLGHASGTVHVADVREGSPIARFLDGFVARYNGTGHEGRYLPEAAEAFGFADALAFYGELDCPWHFADEAAMLAFCTGLFGLIDCPPAALRAALDEVGVTSDGTGVRLAWRLIYADLRATGDADGGGLRSG